MNKGLNSFFVCLSVLLGMVGQSAHAGPSPRLVAIVIAVTNANSDVPEITRLPYTQNDAECVLQSLRKWSLADCVIHKLIEAGDEKATQPTKANIEALVPEWLAECTASDTVLVFFSGHGIRQGDDNQLNAIVPSDVNNENFQDSVVPVQWLRKQLGRCKAQTKFLLLDSCHAGGEGGVPIGGSVKALDSDQSTLDVITIASCGAGEKSHYWKDQNLSIFSYWLGEALRGNADTNDDGMISADELYKYVYEKVCSTASDLGVKQTPVRIVRSGVQGDPIIMKTSQPIKSLDDFLDDVARQVSATMQQKGIHCTGALEFFARHPNGTECLDRSEFGLLANRCAEKLNERLMANLPIGYETVRQEMIVSTLAEHHVSVNDVYSGKMSDVMGTLKSIDKSSLRSFVVGKLSKTDTEGVLDIICVLTGLPNMTTLGSVTGRVCLSQAEIAEMGTSMQVTKPKSPAATTEVTSTATGPGVFPDYRPGISAPGSVDGKDVAVSTIVGTSMPTLVPLDAARMFRVVFEVKRKSQYVQVRPISKNGKVFIPLERGDVYRLRIHNPLPETVHVRVLVDGLNTLPERIVFPEQVKFMAVTTDRLMNYVESLKASGAVIVQDENGQFYQVAAPRGLDDARTWVFAPGREAVIPGFIHEVGLSGNYKEFRVTDASFSMGGQTNFTSQLGLVTIGFFTSVPSEPVVMGIPGARTVGTGMGYKYRRPIMVNESTIPGGILETHQYFYAPLHDIR